MNITVQPGAVFGRTSVPSSKSVAHRQLICNALSATGGKLKCDGISKDIEATIRCLNAMGAEIKDAGDGELLISPYRKPAVDEVHLYCGESGSTLRFLIPVVGALGLTAVFHMEGLLPTRPLKALTDLLSIKGMIIRQDGDELYVTGELMDGVYRIPGNISSQFISGLLFALPLLEGDSIINVIGEIMSEPYINITTAVLREHGIGLRTSCGRYVVGGQQQYIGKENGIVERDWSSAAFLLCMGALSDKGITLTDMNLDSNQGDKKILDILRDFGAEVIIEGSDVTVRRKELSPITIDANDIPDLVPVISVLACGAVGTTVIKGAERLRFKESDRLETTSAMIKSLGGDITVTADGLIINGTGELKGGVADSARDHRIAMSAAVAASICKDSVTIIDAECADKSFPSFYDTIGKLGKM